MKIAAIMMENIKRVKAVSLSPNENGLTLIGGKNGQGKTSILDGIAFALGGDRMRPSSVKRDDALGNPMVHIELDNGLIVERTGKNSELRVTDPSGKRSGQKLLDSLIPKLAIDLPKFMNASGKEKSEVLLGILGIGEKLAKLDKLEKSKCDMRLLLGRHAKSREAYANEMPEYSEAGTKEMSISKLIEEQQNILIKNKKNEEARDNLERNKETLEHLKCKISELKDELTKASQEMDTYTELVSSGSKTVAKLKDLSTKEIEEKIANFEEINRKVRANIDKQKVLAEASDLNSQYQTLSHEIDDVRKQRIELLESSDLPFKGLGVDQEGCVTYQGKRWDCMSSSQQLIVGTAIVSKLQPKCKFVLLDKLEQLDLDTLNEFDKWLKKQGLQAIATRVSTGDECSIIIEDGAVVNDGENVISFNKDSDPGNEPAGSEDTSWDDEEY